MPRVSSNERNAWALSWPEVLGCRRRATHQPGCFGATGYGAALADFVVPDDGLAELAAMDPADCQYVLDELAGRQDLWEEGEQDEP